MIYTVKGYVLDECPIQFLREEAKAGRALKASGATDSDNWKKLEAVEKQIRIEEHFNRNH